jgi:hypothetical protein
MCVMIFSTQPFDDYVNNPGGYIFAADTGDRVPARGYPADLGRSSDDSMFLPAYGAACEVQSSLSMHPTGWLRGRPQKGGWASGTGKSVAYAQGVTSNRVAEQ